MRVVLCLSLLCLAVSAFPSNFELPEPKAGGKTWVLLAGGGNGFSLDWAIQADVYHAYQVFVQRGVPKENIIVMHLDNVANKKSNPTPGKVIHTVGGPDVYHDVPKDYTGKETTAKNFLGILSGDKALKDAGKKVIESGPNDNVFIYFADHGGTQIVSFPFGGYMHAKDMIATLKQMHSDNKYNQMVFYLMACESGSMFNTLLPNDINIYAVSSSLPTQNSYAVYWDDVHKEYLASYFGAVWQKNNEDVDTETVEEQYKYIEKTTAIDFVDKHSGGKWHQNSAHYGSLDLGKQSIGLFEGPHGVKKTFFESNEVPELVDIRNVPVKTAENKLIAAQDIEEKLRYAEELQQILSGRQIVDKHFEEYVESLSHLYGASPALLTTRQTVNNDECYRTFVDTYSEKCLNINENPYIFGKLNVFVNICEHLSATDAEIALNQLVGHCQRTQLFAVRPENII